MVGAGLEGHVKICFQIGEGLRRQSKNEIHGDGFERCFRQRFPKIGSIRPVCPPQHLLEFSLKGLNADADFAKAFKEVYPDGFNQANITDAIQEFERTLLTPNSRFDKYLKGDDSAMTAEELAGYDLFKKYNCATCHVGENMGGQSYELLGIKHDYFADRGTELTVEDNGRFKETNNERDRHRFKVPGLRNVALTAPYFHDGTQATLDEAVKAMAKYEVGVDLSEQETKQLVAFLQPLTGEYQGKLLTNDNELQK